MRLDFYRSRLERDAPALVGPAVTAAAAAATVVVVVVEFGMEVLVVVLVEGC